MSGTAAKYRKDEKGNQEDIALPKKARCHVSSEKFKKKYEGLKDFGVSKMASMTYPSLCIFQDFGRISHFQCSGIFHDFGKIGTYFTLF